MRRIKKHSILLHTLIKLGEMESEIKILTKKINQELDNDQDHDQFDQFLEEDQEPVDFYRQSDLPYMEPLDNSPSIWKSRSDRKDHEDV